MQLYKHACGHASVARWSVLVAHLRDDGGSGGVLSADELKPEGECGVESLRGGVEVRHVRLCLVPVQSVDGVRESARALLCCCCRWAGR